MPLSDCEKYHIQYFASRVQEVSPIAVRHLLVKKKPFILFITYIRTMRWNLISMSWSPWVQQKKMIEGRPFLPSAGNE